MSSSKFIIAPYVSCISTVNRGASIPSASLWYQLFQYTIIASCCYEMLLTTIGGTNFLTMVITFLISLVVTLIRASMFVRPLSWMACILYTLWAELKPCQCSKKFVFWCPQLRLNLWLRCHYLWLGLMAPSSLATRVICSLHYINCSVSQNIRVHASICYDWWFK